MITVITLHAGQSGHIRYTNLAKGEYTFRVVVKSDVDRVVKKFTLFIGYGPNFCYAHWINEGITVATSNFTAEFAGVGGFTSLQCQLDRLPFSNCKCRCSAGTYFFSCMGTQL